MDTAAEDGRSRGTCETPGTFLVVDDEEVLRRALSAVLKKRGHTIVTAADASEALAYLDETEIDVVLCDIQMPGISGLDLLPELKRRRPNVEVLIMTGFGTVERAVRAVKDGAYDFLTKPFEDIDALGRTVERALDRKRLADRARTLENQLEVKDQYEDLVGSSSAMHEVYQLIDSVSHSDANVLIGGESGTGKELVARAIHCRSARNTRPFVVINCSALTETLLESELFGHVRGAFTGATATKRGLFEEAHSGTIFLDEIGDISPMMQVKLLRVLQEGEVKRVGSTDTAYVDVRVLAATNKDLQEGIADGSFREDLYYRLNVIHIELPPLRERVEDIPLLAYHFLARFNAKMNKTLAGFDGEVLEVFQTYRWIGNVRELENVVERAVVLAQTEQIGLEALPPRLRGSEFMRNASVSNYANLEFKKAKMLAVQLFERKYVQTLLARCAGNVSEAARTAGMDRSNFRRIIKKHDITV